VKVLGVEAGGSVVASASSITMASGKEAVEVSTTMASGGEAVEVSTTMASSAGVLEASAVVVGTTGMAGESIAICCKAKVKSLIGMWTKEINQTSESLDKAEGGNAQDAELSSRTSLRGVR